MGELIRVMLVEDDPFTCDSFEHCIRTRTNMELVCQTDSQRVAAEYLSGHSVDVMILDLELKEGDGLSLLEELTDDQEKRPFIFVVTNTISEVTLDMVRADGADYIYQKTNRSYTPDKILSIIDKVFVYQKAHRKLDEEQMVEHLSQQAEERFDRQFIHRQLMKIGFANAQLGTVYMQEILLKALHDAEPMNQAYMKGLYEDIARQYHTGASNVERNIRSAIETAWKHANPVTLERVYPYTWDLGKGRPTNREFIINMVDRLSEK